MNDNSLSSKSKFPTNDSTGRREKAPVAGVPYHVGRQEVKNEKHLMAMLAASTFFTSSPGLAAEKENVCWPLHFAEVTLGISTDPQVTRLIGKGIFRKDEGDTGGRVFVDKAPQTARRLAQSRSGPPGPDKQEKCVNEVISGSPKKRDKYAHKIIPA